MSFRTFGMSQRVAAFVLLFSVAACLPAQSREPVRIHRQEPGVVASPVNDKLATLRYWTMVRMERAVAQGDDGGAPRLDVITPGGDESGQARVATPYGDHPISRVAGKLFFVDPLQNKDGYCSASVITSQSRRLIVTAAHCLAIIENDGSERGRLVWVEHPMFVPAYDATRPATDEQRAPYGLWPIRRTFAAQAIEDDPTNILKTDWDLVVADTYDQLGQPIEGVLGDALVPRTSTADDLFPLVNLVAYPGEAYGGGSQYWCASTTQNNFSGTGLQLPNCRSYFGSSGGSVVLNDQPVPAFAGREVVAVVHNGATYTRLWTYLYPGLASAADADTLR